MDGESVLSLVNLFFVPEADAENYLPHAFCLGIGHKKTLTIILNKLDPFVYENGIIACDCDLIGNNLLNWLIR